MSKWTARVWQEIRAPESGLNDSTELQSDEPAISLARSTSSATKSVRLLMQESQTFEWSDTSLSGRAFYLVERLLRSQRFECIIGLIILANSVCIGVEMQHAVYGEVDPAFTYLEHVFLIIYLLEIGARLYVWGKSNFWDAWFNFDLTLVATGCLASWVLEPMHGSNESGGGVQGTVLSQFMVFRVCRLLRMVRSIRMVKQFRSMWRLVYGLLTSTNTMLSTLFLVILVLYTFACLGTELITKDPDLSMSDNPEIRRIVETFFKDLLVTQMFLFQFVTLDSVAQVYMPLIKEKPILAIYFVAVLLVVSISLMNLVMAKIVEGALDASHRDHEMEKCLRKQKVKELVPRLQEVFQRMDQDGSGMVDLQEFQDLEVPEELAPAGMMDNMMEIFEILDVDHSGLISQEEFIEGILGIHISDVPLQQMQMFQIVRALREKVNTIEAYLTRVVSTLQKQEANPMSGGSSEGDHI